MKLIILTILCLGILQTAYAQNDVPPYDSPTKPVNCEMGYVFINDALGRYIKNPSNYFIVIARLGSGESSRRLNLNRIKTLKSYISNLNPPVKAIFAEGENIKGYGVIEMYVEGKLLYSLPLDKGENLDLRTCLTP